MPTIPEKKKVDPKNNHQGQEIRSHIVARGKLLAQDSNYPDSNILRQTAQNLVAEKLIKLI